MLCMVLLKAQRHNSDLDCAAGFDKFKDFTLISDANSGHFLLNCGILYSVSVGSSAPEEAGMVESIPARNSNQDSNQEQQCSRVSEPSGFCPILYSVCAMPVPLSHVKPLCTLQY